MNGGKTSRLLIGVAVVALLLGAAGLYVGIDAKNGTKSDKELANQVSAEVQQQLAAQAATEQQQVGAQGKKQRKNQIVTQDDIARLRTQLKQLQQTVANQGTEQQDQTSSLQQQEAAIAQLEKQVKQLQNQLP